MIPVIYHKLCRVCKGDLCSEEILKNTCEKKGLPLCWSKVDEKVKEFEEFFEKIVGKPRSVQKFWARRILSFESFAAVAPTGIGKTSFGIAMSLFLAKNGKRCYIILPTTILVKQAIEIIQKYCEKANIKVEFNSEESDNALNIVYYHSSLRKEKEKIISLIAEKRFSILVTTTQFLAREFNALRNCIFDFIFVDDVDAVLKASRNVERILHLLGFRFIDGKWTGKAKGVLMVSTATAKKGQKVRLFRELLNFDVGTSTHAVRNVEDIAVNEKTFERLCEILDKMGKGGIIYASSSEEAQELYEKLKEKYRIGIVTAEKKVDFEKFEKGELDYLIGAAYYYGTLVRGLDLPEKIRFVAFYGAPVFRVRVEDVENASPGIIRLLAFLFAKDERVKKYLPYIYRIREDSEQMNELKQILKELMEKISAEQIEARDVVLKKGEIIFPDVRTYIQGSGRTSRLFAGGITKGASFLMESDEEVLRAFIERAKYYDIEFKSEAEVDFETLLKEIEETRNLFKKRTEAPDIVKPTLFIVESPTKAKQIARFFGQPSVKVISYNDELSLVAYEVPTLERVLLVTASLGHITDLITDRGFHGVETNGKFVPIYASIKRCRKCGCQFTEESEKCPRCESEEIDDSKRRIAALRRLAKEAGYVIIGTDPDSEGEKIAWDLKNLLSGCAEIKRAEFHEVTRRALFEALKNLRDVDENLVKAQIVRRIEDRWIGFILSQKLWDVFGNRNLSAGRAQTPVLGWVIQRAKEHKKKKTVAIIEELGLILEGIGEKEFEVEIELVEEKTEEKTPLPPYTTDALLRDANAILKIPARDAMRIAQDLFERGLITYHRTDSTRVSEVGLRIAKEFLGEDFQGREWYSEGAHECIRPTRPVDRDTLERLVRERVFQIEGLTRRHYALYDLIFRRFMASQCKSYSVTVKKYRIKALGKEFEEERVTHAEDKAFELFKWSIWVKPELKEGVHKVKAIVRKVPIVPLYSQSDIIALMKERGIGRPSTYATIVEKLFIRGYVIEKSGKVIPTKIGKNVYEYLSKNYGKFVSEERTRLLEQKMDEVEKGELDYYLALKELYEEIKEIR